MKNNNQLIKYNIEEYDKKFIKLNYGIKYPEGHVIRHSKYFKNKNSILDFGCGNGTHLEYFSQLKVKNIYGVDTSKIIKKIKNQKFKVFKISDEENLLKKFERKFDVIFSNQVLYYMSDKKINFYLKQFHYLLKKNGIFFSTWMAPIGNYYKLSKKIVNSEMRELKFNLRLKERTFINFKKKSEIEKILRKNNFQTLHYGHYDQEMNHDQLDSGSYHYLNLSKKI
tara:strand:- start:140 stop:814 length:675 start_codon:yes stop_codon:yes gene_type:complete